MSGYVWRGNRDLVKLNERIMAERLTVHPRSLSGPDRCEACGYKRSGMNHRVLCAPKRVGLVHAE